MKFASPPAAFANPPIKPRAEAGAFRIEVSNDGSKEVGTSCPRSASKLAPPIPPTPRLNQRWPADSPGSLVACIGLPELDHDQRFATNQFRVDNRDALHEVLQDAFRRRSTQLLSPPRLGQDTTQVLTDRGIDRSRIEDLHVRGVIA